MARQKAKPVTKNPNIVIPERRVFALRLSEEELDKVRLIMVVNNLPDFSNTIRFLINQESARLEGLE